MEDIIMCYGPVVSVSEGWMVAEENNVYTLLKWDSFYQEWDDVAHRSALRPLTGDERKGFADVWISRHYLGLWQSAVSTKSMSKAARA